MRAILVAVAMLLALGAPVSADESCRTVQDVIKYLESNDPTIRHVIYSGGDANGIKAGIASLAAKDLVGERVFVVFSRPGQNVILIAGFSGGCFEAKIQVTRQQLDDWLAGQGAQK